MDTFFNIFVIALFFCSPFIIALLGVFWGESEFDKNQKKNKTPKILSSNTTFFLKIVLPTSTIFLGLLFFVISFLMEQDLQFDSAIIYLLLLSLWLFFGLSFINLKKVYVHENTLVISNFLKTDTINFSQIQDIQDKPNTHYPKITVYLNKPTIFGGKITFMPAHRGISYAYDPHPYAQYLQRLKENETATIEESKI